MDFEVAFYLLVSVMLLTVLAFGYVLYQLELKLHEYEVTAEQHESVDNTVDIV